MVLKQTDAMDELLEDLRAAAADIEATAVVSVDGLVIASALPDGMQEDRVAAMSAAMLSLGERIARDLGRGALDQLFIKGADGSVVLKSAGTDAVLTVLAREYAKLGLVFLDVQRTAEEIAELL